MGIFVGDTSPSKIFVGGSEVASVRAGDTKVRPNLPKIIDAVIVAGGGGGGNDVGGGGGGGGVLICRSIEIENSTNIIIGAGGGANGNGGDSYLGDIKACGGGSGRGGNGGSGGGSSMYNGNRCGGIGIQGQGHNGAKVYYGPGGGGGYCCEGCRPIGSNLDNGGLGGCGYNAREFLCKDCWIGSGGTGGNSQYNSGTDGVCGGGRGGGRDTAGGNATTCGSGGGGGGYSGGGSCGAGGIVIIKYCTNGDYGISNSTGGQCCYKCNGNCIHIFTQSGIFCAS